MPPAKLVGEPPSLPDLLILNLGHQPIQSPAGHRFIETEMARYTDVPFIVMADHDHPDMAFEAMRLGARGYIHTSLALSVAIAALRLVLAGGTFIPVAGPSGSAAAGRPRPERAEPASAAVVGVLTPRELEVLRRIEQGMTNGQIAQALEMRESTVKTHVRQMKHKTGLRNRVELALKANRLLSRLSD